MTARTAPTRHLPEAVLTGWAAGTADPATSLLAEVHVELCPACRASADEIEELGGALLAGLPAAPLPPGALEALMARLDEPVAPAPPAPPPLPDLVPRALQRYVHEVGGLRWKWVVPGVHRLDLRVALGDRPVQILRFRGGLDIGQHGHEGAELSVVLQGGFTDDGGHYGLGDVALVDATVAHRPVADDGDDCILLVAAEGASLPHSTLGKLVGKLVGL